MDVNSALWERLCDMVIYEGNSLLQMVTIMPPPGVCLEGQDDLV